MAALLCFMLENLSSRKTYSFQQAFLFQWLMSLQAVGVRERKHFKKIRPQRAFGNELRLILLAYSNCEIDSFFYLGKVFQDGPL